MQKQTGQNPLVDLIELASEVAKWTDDQKLSHLKRVEIHTYDPFVKTMTELHPKFFSGIGFNEIECELLKNKIKELFARQKARPGLYDEK